MTTKRSKPSLNTVGAEDDGLLRAQGGVGAPHSGRLVQRTPTALRPHPLYEELCGPITATRLARAYMPAEVAHEPLLTTTDGTILDGHVRWRAAINRRQESLTCIAYDLTEEASIRVLLDRHRRSKGLNDYCRILVALRLEPHYRANPPARTQARGARTGSSNLTKADRKDVRAEIARAAEVSAGNVTKVKQLVKTAIPAVRESLRQGELSIHRAWLWRELPAKQQRQAVWEHQNRKDVNHTIRRLIRDQTRIQPVGSAEDQLRDALGGLIPDETAVVVADLPGNAVVFTQQCCEQLLSRRANDSPAAA